MGKHLTCNFAAWRSESQLAVMRVLSQCSFAAVLKLNGSSIGTNMQAHLRNSVVLQNLFPFANPNKPLLGAETGAIPLM